MNCINKIKNYQKAGYSGIFVLTHEESRFMLELTALSSQDPTLTINEWDTQNGLVYRSGPTAMAHPEDTETTKSLLEYIQNYKHGNTIFVLKDFHK